MTSPLPDRPSVPATNGDDDPRTPSIDVPWEAEPADALEQAEELPADDDSVEGP